MKDDGQDESLAGGPNARGRERLFFQRQIFAWSCLPIQVFFIFPQVAHFLHQGFSTSFLTYMLPLSPTTIPHTAISAHTSTFPSSSYQRNSRESLAQVEFKSLSVKKHHHGTSITPPPKTRPNASPSTYIARIRIRIHLPFPIRLCCPYRDPKCRFLVRRSFFLILLRFNWRSGRCSINSINERFGGKNRP